jgi:hypothetical protein
MKRALFLFCTFILAAGGALAQQSASTKPQNGDISRTAGIEVLIDRYFDSLNDTDEKRRRELTKLVWAEKGKFGTPYGEVEGHEAIDALVAGVHKKFPNSTVRRTSKIDGFGKYLRWSFTLSEADGTPILSGVDFAIIENGKLQLVMGFFDFAPDLANVTAREAKQ